MRKISLTILPLFCIIIVVQTWGCSSMDRVTHYECGGLGFESLMARQNESTYENGCFYFCVHKIEGLEAERA